MSDEEFGVVVVSAPIAFSRLQAMASEGLGDFVKGVVDINQRVMAVGGDLHADAEAVLIASGSSQLDLWGINLYPAEFGEDAWVEYDSLINIRPAQGNRSRDVEDPALRRAVREVVDQLVDGST